MQTTVASLHRESQSPDAVTAEAGTPDDRGADGEPGDDPTPESDAELRAYALRSAYKGLAGLLVLLVAVGLAGVYLESELLGATRWAHATLGVPGLLAIIAAADALTAPIPPDLVLVVVANSPLAERWPTIIGVIGVVSVVAGSGGWLLGRWLGETRVPNILFGRFRRRNQALVTRYGAWAIGLAALTPIPFSVTCWFAGMFNMRYRPFAAVSLLRIPRFYSYYILIAHSEDLIRVFV